MTTNRVSFGHYESGYMIDIRPSAHKAFSRDVAKFIQGAGADPFDKPGVVPRPSKGDVRQPTLSR